jgi:hypothetical protein
MLFRSLNPSFIELETDSMLKQSDLKGSCPELRLQVFVWHLPSSIPPVFMCCLHPL